MSILITLLAFAFVAQASDTRTDFSCAGKNARVAGHYNRNGESVTLQPRLAVEAGKRKFSVEPKAAEYAELKLGNETMGRTIVFSSEGSTGVLTILDFSDDDYASLRENATLILQQGGEKHLYSLACAFTSSAR